MRTAPAGPARASATRAGFDALLVGPAPDDASRVAMSVIMAGMYGTAINPQLADMSDELLHRLLLETTQRLMLALHIAES